MNLRLSATAWINDNGENLDAEGLQLVQKLNTRMEKLTGLTSSTAEAYQGKAPSQPLFDQKIVLYPVDMNIIGFDDGKIVYFK